MKVIVKMFLCLGIILSFCLSYTHASTDYVDSLGSSQKNLNISNKQDGGNQGNTNDRLSGIKDDRHYGASNSGERGISITLVKIARDLKNLFFIIATVYFLIIILRLLFTENSEEEFGKFKKGILWITVGIIIMQLAYSFVTLSFDKSVSGGLAGNIIQGILMPLISLLEFAASFFFIAIAIFSFYRMVTANGDDEKAKSGKMSIFYAVIGFIVVKLARLIVDATYSQTYCDIYGVSCSGQKTLEDGAGVIFQVINWLNGFVGIAVVIMIIYVGAQIIFSNGDEEKIKKAKTSILYIIIGIFILIINYFILTFFLLDTMNTGAMNNNTIINLIS